MRDSAIINGFNNLQKLIQYIDDQTKTALAGEMMMQQAIRKILVKKGICTDKDLSETLSEIIEENNKQAKELQEKRSRELAKPTPEEAAKVEASKKETQDKKVEPSQKSQQS